MKVKISKKPKFGLSDKVILLESNIDDQTPEKLAFAAELLLNSGALDVWFEPIYMKKGRPASKLCVLCKSQSEEKMYTLIFTHTTAIGVRKSNFERRIMQREFTNIATEYGTVTVKICKYGELAKNYIEFESAKKVALANNVTIDQVMLKTLGKIC